MDYNYFEIVQYKGITSPVRIDLHEHIVPLIGINECGKSSLLRGIFAFDHCNDRMLGEELHLKDVNNLYDPLRPEPALIDAEIQLDQDLLKSILRKKREEAQHQGHKKLSEETYRTIMKDCPQTLKIRRTLNGSRQYTLTDPLFFKEDKEVMNDLAKAVIQYLPPLIYFDDFNDPMPSKIDISLFPNHPLEGWGEIMNTLFQSIHPHLSVTTLKDLDDNAMDSILSDVEKKLEETMTQTWTGMKLDETSPPLSFDLKFHAEPIEHSIRLTLKIVERVKGHKRYFNIDQRSKGFYWFLNFVMKVEFHPKSKARNDGRIIFLLDEPGSYLHVSAQRELCKKLAQVIGQKHTVIYCTHSHNLLDPAYIKLPSIRICEKEETGNIKLSRIYEYAGSNPVNKHALEPVYHVLGMNEHFLQGINSHIVLTEGITDFYSFTLFKEDRNLSFFPCTNAKNIHYMVPVFLSAGRQFICLWDGDQEGVQAQKELKQIFGEEIERISFTLSQINPALKVLEDLYDDTEVMERSLEIGHKGDKKKFIPKLFFHPQRSSLREKMPKTQENFNRILDQFLKLDFFAA